jgi:hypothetical protein
MRARRVDANLKVIAAAYRILGCTVDVTNAKWDLTVGYGGIAELVEVKDGAKSASRRKLTPAQVEFRKWWTGGIRLIQSLEDVTAHVSAIRKRHIAITRSSLET